MDYDFGGPGALKKTRPPKIQLGVWESAVSFPSGVCSGAPAEIEFSITEYYSLRI